MLRKKSVRWALSLLLILAIAGGVVLRIRHLDKKAAAELAKKAKSKADRKKKETVKEKPEEKPPPPPPKSTVLSQTSREHLAEAAFISAVRGVLVWRSSQPANSETNRMLLEKLTTISSEGLPQAHSAAWQTLLRTWKALADPAKAADPQMAAQGQQAAEVLNAMFKAHGDGDIMF